MLLTAKSGVRGIWSDLSSGKVIRKVIWGDLASGEYEAFRIDGNGDICYDDEKRPIRYRGKARLHFTPTININARITPPPAQDVPNPAFAPRNAANANVAQLNGGRSKRERANRVPVPLFDLPCQHYGCVRPAAWLVSDEVELPPEVGSIRGRKYLFPRARTVAIRRYCAFHFEPPRLLDGKGKVIEVFEAAGGVRPQWHS